jgi:Ala-tRNA(Pro) deacylase
MAVHNDIKHHLERSQVPYRHKTHPVAYTAQEIAAFDHISGKEMVKTVVLNADGQLILAVVPADRIVNLAALKKIIGCNRLSLVPESEFKERFEPCEPGAMPPFGRLFNVPVYCDRMLSKEDEIEFNAGTHYDTIRMRFEDFLRLETPRMEDFSLVAASNFASRAA